MEDSLKLQVDDVFQNNASRSVSNGKFLATVSNAAAALLWARTAIGQTIQWIQCGSTPSRNMLEAARFQLDPRTAICCKEFVLAAARGGGARFELPQFRSTRPGPMCSRGREPSNLIAEVNWNSQGLPTGWISKRGARSVAAGDVVFFRSPGGNWNAHVAMATGALANDGFSEIVNFGAGPHLVYTHGTVMGHDDVSIQSVKDIMDFQFGYFAQQYPNRARDAVQLREYRTGLQLYGFDKVYSCTPAWR